MIGQLGCKLVRVTDTGIADEHTPLPCLSPHPWSIHGLAGCLRAAHSTLDPDVFLACGNPGDPLPCTLRFDIFT